MKSSIRTRLALALAAAMTLMLLAGALLASLFRGETAGWLVAILALLFAFVLAWSMAGWLVAPLRRLTQHFGQLRQRPEARMHALPARDDELGDLAAAFNGLLTELRQREDTIRKSEEKFFKAFHSNPDFTMISRLGDGMIVEVNEGFEQLIGISAEETVGKLRTADLHMWADPAERERFVSELADRGGVRNFPAVYVNRRGERRQVEINASTIQLAGEPYIIGTSRDVTALMQSQEDLRHSEERFAKAFYANPDYATVSRLEDGSFVAANAGFERLTGWKAEEVLGRSALEIGLWADPEERSCLVRELREHGEWHAFKVHFRIKSGEIRLVEGSCVVVEIGGEQQIVGVARDITEVQRAVDALRHSEEALRELNEDLEQRVRSRTAELEEAVREMESFSYSISHDLRAPLRAIAGYAKIIEEDYAAEFDAEGRRLLDRIARGAIRMGDLIDDLLDFSRIGRSDLKKGPVDMHSLAREVLGDMPEVGSGHHVQMRVDALPPAVADRGLLRQVWANLLSNAIKYSRQRDPMMIEVGGAVEDDELHYWVRDNGVGFDMQYAGKLFQVFQRLHRDPAFEGTGVGLAIVARIVQRHGGRVWAEAEPDQGATFHFTLPMSESPSSGD